MADTSDPSSTPHPDDTDDTDREFRLVVKNVASVMEKELNNKYPSDRWDLAYFSAHTSADGKPQAFVALLRRRQP